MAIDKQKRFEALVEDYSTGLFCKAMLELDEKYREPLILQVIHGFSYREIANESI